MVPPGSKTGNSQYDDFGFGKPIETSMIYINQLLTPEVYSENYDPWLDHQQLLRLNRALEVDNHHGVILLLFCKWQWGRNT